MGTGDYHIMTTVGIVIHADCMSAGHGPGVTTLLSSKEPLLVPKVTTTVSIARMLWIGRSRPKPKARKRS
jgi:hypothetical protein